MSRSPDAESDARLLAGARDGRDDAFAALVCRHGPRMYAMALRLTGDRALSEDAVQDAFVQLHIELARIREPRALAGWLTQVTLNRCRDALRRRRRRAPVDDAREKLATLPGSDPDPDEVARAAERRAALAAAIESLSPELRETLSLRFDADLSYAEIAELLDCPIGSVGSRIHRALAQLARALAASGHEREVS